MGFSAMHPFIGPAKGADILLNPFHQPEGKPLLLLAGMTADRTQLADTGQLQIQCGSACGTDQRLDLFACGRHDRLPQPQLNGIAHQFGRGMDMQLVHDIGTMVIHGLVADTQQFTDHAAVHPAGHQSDHLTLPLR